MKDVEEVLMEEENTDVYEGYTTAQRWNGVKNIFVKSYKTAMKEMEKNVGGCICTFFIIILLIPPLLTGVFINIIDEDVPENGDRVLTNMAVGFVLWIFLIYPIILLVVIAVCVAIKIIGQFVCFARKQYEEGLGEPQEI